MPVIFIYLFAVICDPILYIVSYDMYILPITDHGYKQVKCFSFGNKNRNKMEISQNSKYKYLEFLGIVVN